MQETAEIAGAARGLIQNCSQGDVVLQGAKLVQVLELIEKLATELDKSQVRIAELEKRIPR